jgi:chromosome segregation ATPase
VTESLTSKEEAITDLEDRLAQLKSDLEAALADSTSKDGTVEELRDASKTKEQELAAVTASFDKLRKESEDSSARLHVISQEVCDVAYSAMTIASHTCISIQLESAKSSAVDHKEFVQSLQTQIQTLESEMTTAKANFEVLQSATAAAQSDVSASSTVEHEALQKARKDLDAIKVQTEALTAEHSAALTAAQTRISELEAKVAQADSLGAEIAQLRKEREDVGAKMSELEVEVLELKEAADSAEDEREKRERRIKELEQQLEEAQQAHRTAGEDAAAKAQGHANALEELRDVHKEAAAAATSEIDATKARAHTLEQELAGAHATHEKLKEDGVATAEAHANKLREVEDGHLQKHTQLSEEIQRLTTELNVCFVADSCVVSLLTVTAEPRGSLQRQGCCCQS